MTTVSDISQKFPLFVTWVEEEVAASRKFLTDYSASLARFAAGQDGPPGSSDVGSEVQKLKTYAKLLVGLKSTNSTPEFKVAWLLDEHSKVMTRAIASYKAQDDVYVARAYDDLLGALRSLQIIPYNRVRECKT